MADADIIPIGTPIGTRGRPGRGTGSDKPSSPSRSLAPPVPRPRSSGAPAPARVHATPDPEPIAPARPPVTTEHQSPTRGIPAIDWLSDC